MNGSKDIFELLEKAKESVFGAEVLLREGLHDFSAGRSYYAMFYAAEAILLTKNLSFVSHKAVIAALGKEFVKSGLLPSQLHRNIRSAFRLRQIGDYGVPKSINKEQAKKLIAHAKNFIEAIEEYLRKSS